MNPPSTGPREVVYKNQYQQIYRVRAQFQGYHKDYYVNDYGQRTGVVIQRNDEVLFVRQYRFLVNEVAWEIPGGKVEAGETPDAAAKREALEESGLECRNLKPLLYVHPGLDTFQNPTYLFHTDEFEQVAEAKTDPREIQSQDWVPLDEAIEMVFAGKIIDSITVAALFAVKLQKEKPSLAVKS